MLKRKVMHYIKKWVDSKNTKCLVIQGARQTGKTYIVERFAEENYEEIVEINFKQIPSAMDIFSGDLTVDNMIMAMRFRFPEKKIIPGKTMIFLDEIQECQEAITSLKFLALDNRFDVIASESLLGIDYKRASYYPVGYVDYLKMYGMDFEELFWGMGISEDMIMNLCGYLSSKAAIPEAIHSQMMKYFRQYVAIGGMPEAVQKYIDTKDFREVARIQRSLLQGYQLYFYKNETTKKEIDVIIQKDGKVVPIEVKSGNTRANSLKSIMKNNKDISYGHKFIDGNIGTGEEGIITLPLYMIAFFDKVSE